MNKSQFVAIALLLIATGCKTNVEADSVPLIPVTTKESNGTVTEITSIEQFNSIISQKDRLFIFDLYADWCGPCRQLAPTLIQLAKENRTTDFYKINTEKLPKLAQMFQVQGIPYVVFFKDSAIVNSLTGLYPKEAYEKGIEILSEKISSTADGVVKNGVRTLTLNGGQKRGNISTYRGDKVELSFSATGKPFSVNLAEQSVSGSSDGKTTAKLSFDTKEIGFFPIVITDENGRNDRLWLNVIQYGEASEGFKEMDAQAFNKGIQSPNAFILDVRTPGEFADGYIKGATLIPVAELEERIGELSAVKDKQIFVYCRSGNRSTVAAGILQEKGFKSVVNLSSGIHGWTKANLPLEK